MTDDPIRPVADVCADALLSEPSLLTSVIDQIPDDIVVLDSGGCVVEVNRAVLERLGGTRQNFLGKACREALSGFQGVCEAKEDPALWESVRTGGKSEQVQTVVDAEGRMHTFRVYTYPVMDMAGKLSHVVLLRRDITQRTYMERRLQQSEKLAAVGELSTYVAHEIRNPLFAIAGFANSLLRSGNLDERARGKVSIILEESNRLDKILKSLLNFARPTQGADGQIDVAATAEQTMGLMALGCQKQDIAVRVEVDSGLPLVKGDPDLIKQCLINMVKNSMEAMPEGGELTLRCYLRRGQVVMELMDTGKGILPEHLDQVFNPFFSTKDKGSGLGLAMTRKILDELGGAVELESEVGRGTVVRLVMPPVDAAVEENLESYAAPRHDDIWRGGSDNNGGNG